jgi:acetate kinase
MDAILVLNAGSSSLKFQIFSAGATGLERQVKARSTASACIRAFEPQMQLCSLSESSFATP